MSASVNSLPVLFTIYTVVSRNVAAAPSENTAVITGMFASPDSRISLPVEPDSIGMICEDNVPNVYVGAPALTVICPML